MEKTVQPIECNTRQLCASEIRRVLKPGGRVLAVDFGRARKSGLAHFHRHGHVALEDIVAVFGKAGLTSVSSGPVGMSDLQFVLAEAQPDVMMADGGVEL